MDLCGLFLLLLLSIGGGWFVFVQLILGGILDRSWRWLYGYERTSRARLWVLAGYTLECLLLAAFTTSYPSSILEVEPGFGFFEELFFSMLGITTSFSLIAGLWTAFKPTSHLAPVPPAAHSVDHDAVTAILSSRRALPAIVFSWMLLPLLPIALPIALLFRHTQPPEIKIKLSSNQIEVTSPEKHILWPLHALSIRQKVSWDGTPTLILSREGHEESFFVGGTPPEELEWLIMKVARLAAKAPPLQTPDPPDELRALRARTRETDGQRS